MTVGKLAGILGLSKATVSYALRNSPMVSAKTQAWVQKRAAELGYSPNPVASAFLQQVRARRSTPCRANLAFLIPPKVRYNHLDSLQEGAAERARELGYSLDVIPYEKNCESRLTKVLVARGILGIVIGPMSNTLGHLDLDWSRFACATYGYSMDHPAIHRLVHHHCHGIRTAFRMCRLKGFRRIGFALSNESDLRSNRLWSSGYLGLQHLLPKAERVNLLLTSDEHWGPEKIGQWLLKEKPDVLIIHALGYFPGIQNILKAMPFKVSCAVLDREPDDPCAGIDQQFSLSGKMLVDLLSAQIRHNERGIPQTPILSMVDGVWMDAPAARTEVTKKERSGAPG
ncbi:MAG TPA: LacI family DNA-binding transcriptional regulator [Rariglobus sp.]|nr:LacI family DNA-binding transcriptional regulator [Rariglobus sp.]